MSFEDINFPVYRKYKNNRSYFKIISPDAFDEIRVIGSKSIVNTTEAKVYPEILFIKDMLLNYSAMMEVISEAEYNERLPAKPE